MENIFFTSDTHYGHKNIVKGCTSWEGGLQRCRDFNTLEEHNQLLVDNINSIVRENDTLYHLGDWSFGGVNNIWEFRKQIHCKNIHLIFGNHDQHIENNKLLPNCYFNWCDNPKVILSGNIKENIQNDYSWGTTDTNEVFAPDIFSSVQYYKELKIQGIHLILCHFAMRVWNKSHKGSVMLYGHSHGTLDELRPEFTSPTWIGDQYFIKNYKTMDVGVDTNNLYPYHLDEILDIMKNKEVLLGIDHHSELTN